MGEDEGSELLRWLHERPALSHLASALSRQTTFDALSTILVREGRVALLRDLKRFGVTSLADRQRFANYLTRSVRDDGADHWITGAATSQAPTLKEQGNALYAQGEVAAALEAYEAALFAEEGRGAEHLLHANISFALLQLGETERAADAAQACISLRPDWHKGHFRQGAALAAAGCGEAAAACFETASRLTLGGPQWRQLQREIDRCMARGPLCGVSPQRTSVVPLEPPRFAPLDPMVREHLLREGYVVVRGGVEGEALLELRRLLWAHLAHEGGMQRGAPETWGGERASRIGPAHLGLVTWGSVGQSDFLWRARVAPAVGAAFETAWGGAGGLAMLTSFDGAVVFRPPQYDSSWRTKAALEWLHVDQGATKRGMCGIQGQLLLWDQGVASGGLVCVPRSHLRHDSLVGPHRQADYVAIDANDARLAGLDDARLICARAGDLVLWDSRCVHASCPADMEAPLPREEDDELEGVRGRPRLARAAAMICMVPAGPALAKRPRLAAERSRLVDSGATTTHWPQDLTVVSSGEGAPPGAPLRCDSLVAEARALVRGEHCNGRSRWRAEERSRTALMEMN